jgi:hypothetical protein
MQVRSLASLEVEHPLQSSSFHFGDLPKYS